MSDQFALSAFDRLLRRVQYLDPNFIKDDGTPTSASFSLKKGERGLSVDIEKLTSYNASIQNPNRFRLYAIDTQTIYQLGLACEHDPLPENIAHALILGNITRPIAKAMA